MNRRGNPNLTRLTHGESGLDGDKPTPEYVAWMHLKARCLNPKDRAFPRYGGRGIKVCERWCHSYESFLADMGRKPSLRHSIDRYPDNDGNYEPSNCRWATDEEQSNNASSNIWVTVRGEKMTLAQAIRKFGGKYATARKRLLRGLPAEEALGTMVAY